MRYAVAVLLVLAASGVSRAEDAPAPGAQELYEAAVAAEKGKDYATAGEKARAAVEADPEHWAAWQVLGNVHFATGDRMAAVAAYNRSLKINPHNAGLERFVNRLSAAIQPAPEVAPGPGGPGLPAVAGSHPWRLGFSLGGAGVRLPGLENRMRASADGKLADYRAALASAGTPGDATAGVEGGGGVAFSMAWEFGLAVRRGVGLGLRFGSTHADSVEIEVRSEVAGAGLDYRERADPSHTGILLGGWIEGSFKRLAYRVFGFAGPQIAIVTVEREQEVSSVPGFHDMDLQMYDMTGSFVAYECGAELGVRLAGWLSLFAAGGYRFADAGSLRYGGDVDIDGNGTTDFWKGETFRDAGRQQAVTLDFSGAFGRGGLRASF